MVWIIFALICSSLCVAQPVHGPFVILASDSSSYLSQMRIAPGDSTKAVLFFQRSHGGERMIQKRDLLFASDTLATDSQVVYFAPSGTSAIEVVAAKPNGDWLIVQRRNSQHWVRWETQGDTSNFFAPIQCFDPLNPYASLYGFQVNSLDNGRWLVSYLNWYLAGPWEEQALCGISYELDAASPVDSCVWSDFSSYWPNVFPQLFTLPAESQTDFVLASSYDNSLEEPNFLIASTDSCPAQEESVERYLEGCAMDIRRGRDGTLLALQRSCPVVGGDLRYWVTAFDSSGMLWQAEPHPVPLNYEKIVWHRDFGWAALFYTSRFIDLVRIAANGDLAEPRGTVFWWDGAYQVDEVEALIADDGTIHIVWREFIPGQALLHRYQYATLHWDAALDSRDAPAPLPQSVSLSAFPNPFNSSVQIKYEMPRADKVRLRVFNSLGQGIVTLFDGRAGAGVYTQNWTPEAIAGGVYFIRLECGAFVTTQKVLYIR